MTYQEAIKKAALCLKLAERGGTPEEAAVAAAKAQAIMDKFNLDVDDLDYDDNQAKRDAEPVTDYGFDDPLDDVKYGGYRESWTIRLASTVARSNQCEIRHKVKPDKGVKIRVVGRPSDVQTVRYLYGFFRQQIEALQVQHCVGHSSKYKGEFCYGCIDTLSAKLWQSNEATRHEAVQHAQDGGNSQALVRVNNAVAKVAQRRDDVREFMAHETARTVASMSGLPEQFCFLMRMAKLKEAITWCEQHGMKFSAARRRYYSCFTTRTGVSTPGDRSSSGGRVHGQREGNSIRMTGAKGSIGQ